MGEKEPTSKDEWYDKTCEKLVEGNTKPAIHLTCKKGLPVCPSCQQHVQAQEEETQEEQI